MIRTRAEVEKGNDVASSTKLIGLSVISAALVGAGSAVGAGLAASGLAIAGAMGGRAILGSVAALGARRSSGPPNAGPSGSQGTSGSTPKGEGEAPAWATRLQHRQAAAHAASSALHAVRGGDHGGGGASVSLGEDRS